MFDVNNVSRKIKDARVKKNLTQNALADAMCVSYQAVSNWERGNAMPEEKLDKLAEKVVPETYSSLCAVAPFVSQKTLDKMAEKVRNPDIDDVLSAAVCLVPFLSGGALKKIFKKAK